VFRAIGQTLTSDGALMLDGRKIAVTGAGRTSRDLIWRVATVSGGDDLTVTAVAEGRDAAIDIHVH
jgi:glutamate synthase (NADPH/NADH) small chain